MDWTPRESIYKPVYLEIFNTPFEHTMSSFRCCRLCFIAISEWSVNRCHTSENINLIRKELSVSTWIFADEDCTCYHLEVYLKIKWLHHDYWKRNYKFQIWTWITFQSQIYKLTISRALWFMLWKSKVYCVVFIFHSIFKANI